MAAAASAPAAQLLCGRAAAGARAPEGRRSALAATAAAAAAAAVSLAASRRRRPLSALRRQARSAIVEAIGATVLQGGQGQAEASEASAALAVATPSELWTMCPPDHLRDRIGKTIVMLGRPILAFVGDAIWEFLVLKHQYMQLVKSPFTENQTVRTVKQAKVAAVLWHSDLLTKKERSILLEGTRNSWKSFCGFSMKQVEQVGIEQFSAAHGLRTLLGFMYIDTQADDSRLEMVAREVGLQSEPHLEDELLREVTGGFFDKKRRPNDGDPKNYFLALAPLGHLALRLYVSRYFCQRPVRPEEFIIRVKMALRTEDLDLAAAGFLRDMATPEEALLMRSARDSKDSFAFAFECLLGYLVLTAPYRLHQIIADFGWARQLPEEYLS